MLTEENSTKARPALFLDRDGVIIEDKVHISRAESVTLHFGAQNIIGRANLLRIPVVVVTNQSGVGRGYFTWDEYESVTDKMLLLLGEDAKISAIYANGNAPGSTNNDWRKPGAGMLLAAKEDLNIDLSRSAIIGDRLSDLEAGKSAGLSILCHVLTGHGAKERPEVIKWQKSLSVKKTKTSIKTIDKIGDFRWLEKMVFE